MIKCLRFCWMSFLFFCCTLSTTILAQDCVTWQNPLPVGNNLVDVFFVNDTMGWAVGEAGTILYTANSGTNWSAQKSTTNKNLKGVFFINTLKGFACGDEGKLLKTTDGGKTWLISDSGTNINLNSIAFYPGSQTGIAVGDNGEVRKTTNDGLSWSQIAIGTTNSLTDVQLLASSSSGWLVGEGGVVFKTTNSGNSWVSQPSGITTRLGTVNVVNASSIWAAGDNGTIIKTANGGTGWATLPNATNKLITSICTKDNNIAWFVGIDGQIFKSSNSGTSWSPQVSNTTRKLSGMFCVNNNKLIVVGDNGTILQTLNGGTLWKTISTGKSVDLNDINFSDASNGWAVGDNGFVLNTKNGGKTWVEKAIAANTSMLGVSFINPQKGTAVGQFGSVYSTVDSGNVWTKQNVPSVFYKAIYSLDSANAWIVGESDTLLRLVNNSWTKLSKGDNTFLNDVFFISKDTGWACGQGGKIFKSTNGGLNWSKQIENTSETFFSIRFKDNQKGWAVGSGGAIYRTVNGGSTWTKFTANQNFSQKSVNRVVYQSGKLFAFGSEGLFLTSSDEGLTWVEELSFTTFGVKGATFLSTSKGWVAGQGGVILTFGSPDKPIVANVNYCQGATPGKLTAIGSGLLWYSNPTGGVGDTIAPTPSTANIGVQKFYVTQSGGSSCGESERAEIVVTVSASLQSPVFDPTIELTRCQGSSAITYAASALNSSSIAYTLTPANAGTINALTGAVVWSATYTGTATIKAIAEGACNGPKESNIVITTRISPTVAISGGATLCSGASAQIEFTGTPNCTVTYKINGGADLSVTLSSTGTASVGTGALLATTTYNLVGVRYPDLPDCGKALTGAAVLTIRATPTAAITGTSSICEGTAANISFSGTPNCVVSYKIDAGVKQTVLLDATGKAILTTGALLVNTTYFLLSVQYGDVPDCMQPLTGSAVVTVKPTPTATINGSATICAGSSSAINFVGTANCLVVYKINGGTDQSVTLNSSGAATVNSGAITSNTTYSLVSVKYSEIPECAKNVSGTVVLTVRPLPAATISGTTTICEGSSTAITLAGTPDCIVSYKIGSGATQTVTLNSTGTASLNTSALTTSVTYTLESVKYPSGADCNQSLTGSAVVSVRSTPVVTIEGTVTFCAGLSTDIKFTGTPAGVVTYKVNGGADQTITLDVNGKATLNTGVLSNSATYTLVSIKYATAPECSKSATGSAVVTVNQMLVIQSIIGTSPTNCGGVDGFLSFNGLQTNTIYTVSYSRNGLAQPALQLTTDGSGTLRITGLSKGVYSDFGVVLGSCSGSNSTVVTISDPGAPAIPTSSQSTILNECVSSFPISIGVNAQAGVEMNWYKDGAVLTSNQTTILANVAGVYEVEAQGAISKCVSASKLKFTLTAVANPVIPDVPIKTFDKCQSQVPFNMSAVPPIGAFVEWYNVSTGGSSLGVGNFLEHTNSNAAIYNYFAESKLNGSPACRSIGRSPITVNITAAPPAPSAMVDTFKICQKDVPSSSLITVTPPNGSTVNWYNVAIGGTPLSTNSNTIIHINPVAGNYTYFAESETVIGNCRSVSRKAIVVKVSADPVILKISGSTTINCGEMIDLTCENSCPTCTYQWSNGLTTKTIKVGFAGDYGVTLTDPSSKCAVASKIILVGGGDVPVVSTILKNVDTIVCGAGQIELSVKDSSGYSYLWNTSKIANKIVVDSNGIYAVTVTNKAAPTCKKVLSINVNNFLKKPAALIDVSANLCGDKNLTVTPTDCPNCVFTWKLPDNSMLSSQNIGAKQSGNYELTLKTQNCENTFVKSVEVNPFPDKPEVTNSVISVCKDDFVTLTTKSNPNAIRWEDKLGAEVFMPILGKDSMDYFAFAISAVGCKSLFFDKTSVFVNPIPKLIEIVTNGTVLKCGDSKKLYVLSADCGVGCDYFWSGNFKGDTLLITSKGTYVVTVVNSFGCKTTGAVEIFGGGNEPSFDLIKDNKVICSTNDSIKVELANIANCFGCIVNWEKDSLASTFVYLKANDLVKVTLTNADGCSAAKTITVDNFKAKVTTKAIAVNSTCQSSNGSIQIVPESGTPDYVYKWSDVGSDTSFRENLAKGMYLVTITDMNGCKDIKSIEVTNLGEKPIFSISQGKTTQICDAFPRDTLFIENCVNCGKYIWSNGSTSFINEITNNGIYTVTVTNDTSGVNCSSSKSITVSNFASAVLFDVSVTPSTCKGKNGSILIEPKTGIAPFTFSWSNTGISVSKQDNLSAGDYFVTVTDSKGCSKSDFVYVSDTNTILIKKDFIYQLKSSTSVLYLAAQDSLCYKWLIDDGKGGYLPAPCGNQNNSLKYCELAPNLKVALTIQDCKNLGCSRIITKLRAVDEENLATELQVFPNPANEQIHIVIGGSQLGSYQFNVFDVVGRNVLTKLATKTQKEETFNLQVEEVPPGPYLLIVQDQNGKKSPFKIIIQK